MDAKAEKRKSRHFTVVVRREFRGAAEEIFAAWTDPEVRRNVLGRGRSKNDVKEVSVMEGGLERYEDRWKNRLYGRTTRRYSVVRPARLIVAHSEITMEGEMFDQHFAKQELLLFKPKGDTCEIVASDQCVSIEPSYVHAAEDSLNEIFDAFESLL